MVEVVFDLTIIFLESDQDNRFLGKMFVAPDSRRISNHRTMPGQVLQYYNLLEVKGFSLSIFSPNLTVERIQFTTGL